jgi:hypothetical protein
MRGATECARRVKQLFRSLRAKLGKVNRPQTGDPPTQMILGVLTRDMPEARAREALEKMRGMVVDYNELRVIAPLELAEMVGEYPGIRTKCEDISRALNKVFALDHSVTMERLAEMNPRDAAAYLDKVDGLEAYSRARVRLLGLRHHAIPLDEAMWAYAKAAEIVDPKTALEDAQRFLERQVAEEDALEFVALLRKQAWNETASAVRRGEVEHIRSIPPDRTSRNMLQPILPQPLATLEVALDEAEPPTVKGRNSKPTAGRTKPSRSSKPAPDGAKPRPSSRPPARIPTARKRAAAASRKRSARARSG